MSCGVTCRSRNGSQSYIEKKISGFWYANDMFLILFSTRGWYNCLKMNFRKVSPSGSPSLEGSKASVRALQAETFIEEIQHEEPGAVQDPDMAAMQVQAQGDEDFANLAEMRLALPDRTPSNRVHLVSFRSGKGKLFRSMLLRGPEFRPIRLALKEHGFPLMLVPSTTLILVPPEQYLMTVNSPTLQGRALKRYSVIVAESAEHLISEVQMRMSARQRPYENRGARIEVDLNVRFVINRTFIEPAQNHLVSGITESTSEAVRTDSSMSSSYLSHFRGGNPRRRVAQLRP
eukprot:12429883-Karenia_brevis.AAC.1